MANIITRRSFLKAGFQATAALGLASLTTIPPFLKRALAEGNIGINGKKLIFIFLRGGNDGVNNILPIQDPSYLGNRALIGIRKDPGIDYSVATGVADAPAAGYQYGIRLGNGFAALNPAMADLVPLYNAGQLALIHRVAYRSQSRSHFDSEVYWEKAADGVSANNRKISDGLWYRTIVESGWNRTHALSGVSIQSNMPQSLRGVEPMTNLSTINRYNVLGVYTPVGATNTDRVKILNAIDAANLRAHPSKDNRELVHNLGLAFRDTLDTFQSETFNTNSFFDTDGTTHLFPIGTSSDVVTGANPTTYRFGSGFYGFMQNIKSCAQMLSDTPAIISGTEMGGFDTHTGQVTAGSPHLGGHASLLRRLGWAYYALWRYFTAKNMWDNVVVVTMSEFGRTSAENASMGTDHGESSVMYVAGGGVKGGVYGCSPADSVPWLPGTGAKDGSLFAANNSVGYLKRAIDYRSVVGEIIRDHLGATQNQLNRIIPAYLNESVEHLRLGGTVSSTPIIGELGLV
ncbi:MAG: hypothetical protein QOF48_2414 [Verrucomicrobiota bacterium]